MNASLSAQGPSVAQRQGFSLRQLFSRQRVVNFLKLVLPFAVLTALFPQLALAAGASGDLLKTGDDTVKQTAGSGSTMYKWIILGEVLTGLCLYVFTHSFKFLFGFIILSIIGNVGMKVAGY
ncbi:type IV conjugative transfer system pilin TraA [Serratia ureilytica]|uniref:type IV conjugative transfer system pilin TraA n=1 Tax=Serratia ureilytica TaxID=300181 RepID=UPI003FA68C82|nr:hypothetical protein SM14BL09_47110 [Serratia marcescens]